MKSIRAIPFLLILLVSANGFSNEPDITGVTVYRSGAKISHTTKVNLKPGNQEVVIGNLTSSIDPNSLQVQVKGSPILLSASVRQNFVDYQTLPKRQQELKDSVELLGDQIDWLNHEQSILQGEEKLIVDNQKIVNEKEKITAQDLAQLADFYKNRLTKIRKNIYQNNIILRNARENKARLEQQLKEINYRNGRQMGEIVLNISSGQSMLATINFSYLSRSAGWNPLYDIRCSGIDKPLDLVAKANVYQNTGYDWEGVDLVISTGNPTANNERPIMNPWYINFYQPPVARQAPAHQKSYKAAQPSAMENMLYLEVNDDAEAEMGYIPYAVSEISNQMNIEYSIKVKQDIPSDGKEHIVAIRNIELPASYNYYSAPKLDLHAFLLARIGDYGQYDLLPGSTNIFFEGMFVGQTYLSTSVPGDSLILSLGRDDRINISRNLLSDMTSSKTIGPNKKVVKAYEIIVKNNKQSAVSLQLLDQVPIAQNKDIVVELEEEGGAEYTADYGKLIWRLNLAAGEQKKLRFTYSVRYPKDMQISGLN